ncbi:helix-turn-helix domain-containing protein [Amycolatopsis sp. NPDC058278]|uniref:helix-turn-helix domain-containing protein n=1 Tax=Amycolatopsis sp. NPDC058278 TaxID=3346417 RepID=UPI0036DD5E5A
MSTAFPRDTHRSQASSTRAGRRWLTIGEHVTATHRRSATDDLPDPDWLPWPPTARNCPLPLPRHERTPYRVWEVMELRARYVRWPQIAARLGLPEHVVRDWIHRHGNR